MICRLCLESFPAITTDPLAVFDVFLTRVWYCPPEIDGVSFGVSTLHRETPFSAWHWGLTRAWCFPFLRFSVFFFVRGCPLCFLRGAFCFVPNGSVVAGCSSAILYCDCDWGRLRTRCVSEVFTCSSRALEADCTGAGGGVIPPFCFTGEVFELIKMKLKDILFFFFFFFFFFY